MTFYLFLMWLTVEKHTIHIFLFVFHYRVLSRDVKTICCNFADTLNYFTYFKPALAVLYLIVVEVKSAYNLWPPGAAAVFNAASGCSGAETSHSLIGCWWLGSNSAAHAQVAFFGLATEICQISGAYIPLIPSNISQYFLPLVNARDSDLAWGVNRFGF